MNYNSNGKIIVLTSGQLHNTQTIDGKASYRALHGPATSKAGRGPALSTAEPNGISGARSDTRHKGEALWALLIDTVALIERQTTQRSK